MSNSLTILLIDYDPGSVRTTREPLENAGYIVEVANDGEEGLLAFDRLKPDLVLIEPMVPKKHGFQVCQEIKSTSDGKKTPVLITTAFYRGRKHRSEAQQNYGCDDYLEKPIPEELLLSTCRKYLIDIQAPATGPAGSHETAPAGEVSGAGLPSLDDLSDDEIQARLDALIDEELESPSPVASPAPVPDAAAPELETATLGEVPPAEPPSTLTWEQTRTEDAEELPAPSQDETTMAEAELPAEAVASRTELLSPEPAQAGRASRLPLWITVAAIVCVASGAAILWFLQGRDGSPAATTETRSTLPRVSKPAPEPSPGIASPAEGPRVMLAKRGDLLALEQVDRAPVAENTPAPVYPLNLRDSAAPQPVVLRLLVDETGRVTQIEVDTAGSDALVLDSVVGVARGWTYEPALKDGVPVKVWITETFGVEPSPTGQAS